MGQEDLSVEEISCPSISVQARCPPVLSQSSSQGIIGKTLLFILVGIITSPGWTTSCSTLRVEGLQYTGPCYLLCMFYFKINLFYSYQEKLSVFFVSVTCSQFSHRLQMEENG